MMWARPEIGLLYHLLEAIVERRAGLLCSSNKAIRPSLPRMLEIPPTRLDSFALSSEVNFVSNNWAIFKTHTLLSVDEHNTCVYFQSFNFTIVFEVRYFKTGMHRTLVSETDKRAYVQCPSPYVNPCQFSVLFI